MVILSEWLSWVNLCDDDFCGDDVSTENYCDSCRWIWPRTMCHSHVTKKAWHLVLFTFPQLLLIHHPDIIGIGSTAPFESLKILSSSRMIPLTGPIAKWDCTHPYPDLVHGVAEGTLNSQKGGLKFTKFTNLKLEVMNLGFTRLKELPYNDGNPIHFSQRSEYFTQLAAFAEKVLQTYKNSVVDCSLPSSKAVRTSIMGKRAIKLNIDYPLVLLSLDGKFWYSLFSNHLTIHCSIGCFWWYNLTPATWAI